VVSGQRIAKSGGCPDASGEDADASHKRVFTWFASWRRKRQLKQAKRPHSKSSRREALDGPGIAEPREESKPDSVDGDHLSRTHVSGPPAVKRMPRTLASASSVNGHASGCSGGEYPFHFRPGGRTLVSVALPPVTRSRLAPSTLLYAVWTFLSD